MQLDNTQANIFKVNGGIADNFANRPIAQNTFYLFYSIDTQEIFYDNGNWIKLGSGGANVNIYNSNGTLTGNRTLSGANYDLTFSNLANFDFITNNGVRLKSAFNNFETIINNITRLNIADNFFNLNASNVDISGSTNTLNLKVNNKGIYIDNNDIKTYTNNSPFININGYNLQITNRFYQFGQITGGNNINLVINDALNTLYILCNPITSGGTVNGLSFNFTNNREYFFGQITGGSTTNLRISDLGQTIETRHQGNTRGLLLNFSTDAYVLGKFFTNPINLTISGATNVISTQYLSQQNGIIFNYPLRKYILGQFIGSNQLRFEIDDIAQTWRFLRGAVSQGIEFNYSSNIYMVGQINGNNATHLYINDTSQLLYTGNNSTISNGLYCDFANHVYQFGRATGGNTTYITITDAATYPLQIDGTNVLSGTSGGFSGQHLKININGTDYKIKLENP